MMVTEKVFRLAHYDRSGSHVTPTYDIHKFSLLFVRLVLGLSSPDERVVGLDTSVQWTITATTGRKTAGTITISSKEDATKTTVCDLDMRYPPILRPTIRGRGTVGWHALDSVTRRPVLLKDAWRSSTQNSETDFLLRARGIPGVAKIISFQDFCAQTSDYRPKDTPNKHFKNLTKARVALKKYGPSIQHFTSRLQLFQALKAAFIGTLLFLVHYAFIL